MNKKSYNNFFINFSSKTKFDIVMALREGPLSVNEIVGIVGGEQSAVSHSLRKMSACHLLNVKKEGKQRIYSLNRETVIPMLRLVEKHVKKHCLGRCRK